VLEGADELRVTTGDRREFQAEVVGTDPKSDLAVLRVKGAPKGLTPLEFGDSQRLRLDDVVLAVGNPLASARP
jgi:S1-C subfamily serine protease